MEQIVFLIGIFLIIDGGLSIYLQLKESILFYAGRILRIGIGFFAVVYSFLDIKIIIW